MSKGQHMTNFYCFFCHSCFQNMFYTWCLGRNKPRSINAMCFLNLSTTLKVVSTTFGPITIFKQQSLLFHLLHKITFSSLSTTSFASLVFIAFVLQILRRDSRSKHNFEKQYYCGNYSDDVYQCLSTDQILHRWQLILEAFE